MDLSVLAALLGCGFVRYGEWKVHLAKIGIAILWILFQSAVLHFPYNHDGARSLAVAAKLEAAYKQDTENSIVAQARAGEDSFADFHKQVARCILDFAREFDLTHKKVLDIGSGNGYLQDVVADYTGVDIQPGVASLYHRIFILGSMTALPFRDNEFDAAWSIAVLEHVANPETGLGESRRVVHDGGLLFLFPAWNVPDWKSGGYAVRPYRDLDFRGKLEKASLILRDKEFFYYGQLVPVRLIRLLWNSLTPGPTGLRYRLLDPNANIYWQEDSDAVNSIDRLEVQKWFESRGDVCANCRAFLDFLNFTDPLIIRIHKP